MPVHLHALGKKLEDQGVRWGIEGESSAHDNWLFLAQIPVLKAHGSGFC